MKRPAAALASGLAAAVLAGGCGSSQASPASVPSDPSRSAAQSFLTRYVEADGRVVRRDQGSDTVSEGQAYAMLLDVAVGDQRQFARVWGWSQLHLGQANGLLAFHWKDGRVLDPNSASDADLDVARALVLAGERWANSRWTAQGRGYASAVLANETVELGGQRWLVAGPWSKTSPLYLNPSYFDPAAFALLGRNGGDSRWAAVASSSLAALAADTGDGRRLPSDWAQVDDSGRVQASAPPGGGATLYGYDAFRTLIRQADSCVTTAGTTIDRSLRGLADKSAAPSNRANTYNSDATPSQAGDNPLMLVAAAGSAHVAGDAAATNRYLNEAATAGTRHPSYFLDAWVALGRYLLTTQALNGCTPPSQKG